MHKFILMELKHIQCMREKIAQFENAEERSWYLLVLFGQFEELLRIDMLYNNFDLLDTIKQYQAEIFDEIVEGLGGEFFAKEGNG